MQTQSLLPKLRFPEFTEAWSRKVVSDVLDNHGGIALEEHAGDSGTHHFISIGNYSTDGHYIDNGQRISKNSKTEQKLLSKNDLVMVLNDKTAAGDLIGATILIDENDKYIYNQRSERLVVRKGIDATYLWQLLNSRRFRKRIYAISQGGTQIYVNFPVVKKLEITLPLEPEQQKIASFLSAIDTRIRNDKEKLELLKQYQNTVTQKIFAQRVRFKDENSDPYPDWEVKKLGKLEDERVLKLGRGDVISKTDVSNHPGIYPIYSSSVKNMGLFGRYGKYMFDEELITWSVDGGGDFFYRPKTKFSVTNVSGWLRILDKSLDCRFLSLQLQHLHAGQNFDYQTKAHPSVIRNIYTLQIPAPAEQQKIASFLIVLEQEIKTYEATIYAEHKFKNALLQRMFV